MKVLHIGDIHGRDNWKQLGDISSVLSGSIPEYDKYVFLGDYVDSFFKSNVVIKRNLLDIIAFKESFGEHVELLWGNHDVQYLYGYNKHGCSGFRPEAYFDLHDIFTRKKGLFKLAYGYDNVLFTHAGVHLDWYENRFKDFDDQDTLADSLNWAFDQNIEEVFDVGYARGGRHPVGGVLWLDKLLGSMKPLGGYHQYVGHTSIAEIETFNINDDTSITFCDYLEWV